MVPDEIRQGQSEIMHISMNTIKDTIRPKINFNYLSDYASFLLENKLNDFALEMLKITREEKVSFLPYYETLSEQDKIDLFLKNSKKLLGYMVRKETQKYLNLILKWLIDNQFTSIKTTQIVANDIIIFAFINRKVFRNFLSQYTNEIAVSVNIMEEADGFISVLEEISFNTLFHLNEQKTDKHFSEEEKNYTLLARPSGQLLETDEMEGLRNFVWDFEGDTSICSPQLMKIFELENKDKFESFLVSVHPNDRKKIKEACDKSLDDSEYYESQYRFQKIENEKVIWSNGIMTFQEGKPIKMKGSVMDVTHNYQLNQKLKESEKTFRQLIQNAPDAIVLTDENSKILFWNPKAEVIFGWTPDEITGKTLIGTIIPPSGKNAFLHGLKRANVLNKTIEIIAINKMGKEFFIALSIASSYHNGKQVFISFIRDISKEKKNELELEHHRDQLTQKNSELKKTNTELTSFSYVASHDLKEPLRKIKTYSNFIIEKNKDTLPPDAREYIQRIITSTTNMQRLIDDLLAFSRTSSDEKKLETLDLNILLEEVESSLKDTIENRNVTITSTKLPTLQVISFQFRQLFENIIGNAIKYSKADVKPNITIIASHVSGKIYINEGADPNKYYHKILFADSGIGFDQEYAKRIFEIFQRLHGKNEYSGTGIGLAICRKIMENHNGFITAQSKEGEGSIFNIFIPVSEIGNTFAKD